MIIPKILIDYIRGGQVVLFLGSGASIGAVHPQGSRPPTGDELSRLIAEKFLGSDFYNRPLAQVAELAISESDLFTVQDFIASLFRDFHPADFHKMIPKFVWSAIVSTNYDLIVERAYNSVEDRLQQPITLRKNGERVERKLRSEDNVIYLKLHGCITDINDPEVPLILTPDQYVMYRRGRSRLFERLQSLAYEYPFLFVGYSISDPDIRAILLELDELEEAKPRSYLVAPRVTDVDIRFWENRKISTISMPFQNFLIELDREIPLTFRPLSTLSKKHQHPIFGRFCITDPSKVSASLMTFLTRDVLYVDKTYKTSEIDPKAFYKGFFVDLSPIVNELDVKRSLSDSIMSEVLLIDEEERRERQEFYLIKGHAGSGKTIILSRIAWEASTLFNKLCLVLKPSSYPEYEPLCELQRLCNERIFLFVDPVVEHMDIIEHFISRARKDKLPLTILGAERQNEWNTECERLESLLTDSYGVKYLSEKEIENLIDLLTKHKSLGYLGDLTFDQQKEALSKKAGRQLLVALHEATLGKPFSDIVLDEYRNISSPQAQSLYLTVCILHRLGVATRAGLISRVHGIPFRVFSERLFKPLEFIVFATYDKFIKDYVYCSRHPQIAEIVFERVLAHPQERYDEYVRIINCLDIDYSSDWEAFKGLTKAKHLLEMFPDKHMIRQIYTIARTRAPEDLILMQQEAIFEMNSPEGSFEKASNLLLKAQKKAPYNKAITHSLSVLALRKAENAKTALERNKYIEDSRRIALELTSSGTISAHPYHTLITIGIDELRKLMSESYDESSIEKQIKELEQRIAKTIHLFPESDFILQAEADFCELIHKNPQALAALKKAFLANKRSPFIATRLAAMYESAGNLDQAIETLRESVDANPSEKYTNFKLALLLMKSSTLNKGEIRHHLRRAFTEGDSNYDAQFQYARFLYIEGEIPESLALFRKLGEVNIDNRDKKKPRGKIMKDGAAMKFLGTIQKMEASYAFIIRDGWNDKIFTPKNLSDEREWRNLKPARRVSFELSFNYKGPVALNVRLETTPPP